VAQGDLSGGPIAHGTNEVGQLLEALLQMRRQLTDVVRNVRGGSESVATASVQIAQGNIDLSARTESQASALEETAASMEQLNATVRQNADSAQQASQLAASASTVAVQGGEVVAQVVDTMKHINASSQNPDIIDGCWCLETSWRSMPWKPPVRASRAEGLPWWPARCAAWPSAAPRPPRRSRPSSTPAWSAWNKAPRWWTRRAPP
jgi:hypothetical protein